MRLHGSMLRSVFAASLAAGLGLFETVFGAEDELALGVRTTEPLPPSEQQKKFQLPPGFEIQLVAAEPDINKPLNMAFDATGRLWVTTSIEYPWAAPTNRPARDRLMIFEDFGPDGRARKVTQFADGLNIPIGVYPFRTDANHWKAIVWSIPNIWVLEDTDGDGKADKKEALYGPFDHTRDTHGNQASFRRGFDGWLYATHGYNNDSHVTARDGSHVDLNSGNTYRIRVDGSRIEQHTHGQVNPFGLAWDSRGNLYSSDCHSAPIYQLLNGGWYPSFGKPHDGLGYAPVMLEHAHGSTAIDGACYYTDDLWPTEYQDTFFIGNVMTSRLNRDKITFIGSTPKATEQPDFLTSTDPWFRPVDNTLGPDGALYVADFYNRIIGHYEVPLTHPGRDRERGRLWRVVYRGNDGKANLRPPALPSDLNGLISELGSPSLARRLLAMSEIQDRWGDSAAGAVLAAVKNPANTFQHVHALWLLHRLGGMGLPELQVAASAGDPLLRIHAQRIMADILYQVSRGLPIPAEVVQAVRAAATRGLGDSDALVQRCAADALGNLPNLSCVRPLLDLLALVPGGDTHLRYVVRQSLRNQLADATTFNAILSRSDWTDDNQLALASVALTVKTPQAASFVLRNLRRFDTDPASIAPALEHAARYAPESDLPQVAAYAKAKFADDLKTQLSLFNGMQKGLQQRGAELPASLRGWGTEIAQQAFSSLDANSLGWASIPLNGYNNLASWAYQERPAADGTKVRVLSSLPPDESLTGVLSSPVFRAPRELSFWLCGHDGPPDRPAKKTNYVRLRPASERLQPVRADKPSTPLAEAAPPRNDTAQKIMLGQSDFLTGAFPAEFGNTIAGV
ncbi:MAG TPA: hypothetical protein PLX89_17855, partial [Verrucomicrobiota bacterium]|nr:hypothetical protein [Verrucomicrobiota bacterium]